MLYSASTNSFYTREIHGPAVPKDAVEISAAEHSALMSGQARGMMIAADTLGRPILKERPTPTAAEALAAERARMVVSRFQAKAALHAAGRLADVERAVAAADPITRIAWTDAGEFRRSSPTIAALAAAVGMTDEEVDNLFRSAAEITA
ncbi:hypothetical protein EBL87_08960 [Cereibacter sphaeroides]|uniref:hypothetical protein n=1 Tax=Cereibacter sphaeroides TaxID=1063 RepID=UPI000F52056A|nr:hypothetical protein [Cereibacter sphaeroides]AZB63859.1 hypothetical protein EBL87_08960 [Cereibacter sphaeroides]AZB68219.1 hypothetical protein EBL86_07510 [Cereibacter sphaeroides]